MNSLSLSFASLNVSLLSWSESTAGSGGTVTDVDAADASASTGEDVDGSGLIGDMALARSYQVLVASGLLTLRRLK